jgi:hypothetical protein
MYKEKGRAGRGLKDANPVGINRSAQPFPMQGFDRVIVSRFDREQNS